MTDLIIVIATAFLWSTTLAVAFNIGKYIEMKKIADELKAWLRIDD